MDAAELRTKERSRLLAPVFRELCYSQVPGRELTRTWAVWGKERFDGAKLCLPAYSTWKQQELLPTQYQGRKEPRSKWDCQLHIKLQGRLSSPSLLNLFRRPRSNDFVRITNLPACLPTHPPTHLPTYLPTYLPTCLPACLPE